jgi:hypothetical protein
MYSGAGLSARSTRGLELTTRLEVSGTGLDAIRGTGSRPGARLRCCDTGLRLNRLAIGVSRLGVRGTRLWLSSGLGFHGTRLGLGTWFGVRGRTLGLSTRLAANCTSLRFRGARLGFHGTLLGFCLHGGYDGHKDGAFPSSIAHS